MNPRKSESRSTVTAVTAVFVSGAVLGAAAVMAAAGGRVAGWRRQAARARFDELTGVLNRAGLAAAWAARPGRTVALLDLDNFKPVNDTLGHAAGDRVLATVAARLYARVPDGRVARLGGDEFALMLGCDVGEAYRVAALAAADIAVSIPVGDGRAVTVTASIGLAPVGDRDLSTVLALADAAMYRAKGSRCTVAVHDPAIDDRTCVQADPRPAVRVRELPATTWPMPPVPAQLNV